MIIELLLSVIKNLLSVLLIFELPSLPDSVNGYLETFSQYISSAVGIVANYTPYDYLVTLFFIIVAIDSGLLIYKFVMWILRKIPMLSIK